MHEVAERLGYGEASAFVRAFRRGCGVPPHRWRMERQRG
jgi:AraC-like DNA-binding protein